jgi:tyrosyl-tRNA synthetase
LIVEIGFATSKSEARKLIKNSGVKINRIVVSEELMLLTKDDFNAKNEVMISVGKKRHFLIKLIN